jgi:CDP-diacylglycerol--serine O-phosphatidyltransferase
MADEKAEVTARSPNSVREPRNFRPIPIRYLLPNLLTLLALCSGVTAIRFAIEGHMDFAVLGVIFSIALDALDGRLARYLQGTSRFGAELDSLADFVNFGVAPAILVYLWSLNGLKTFGWVVCLMLAIGCALRLARFNVAIDDPKKPAWASGFFIGMPAPAGALLSMLPLYLGFLGIITEGHPFAKTISGYEVLIAALMVSRVPTFSGKNVTRVPREYALLVLAAMALFIVLLISFPWETLSILSLIYLLLIPLSMRAYLRHKKAGRG